MVSGALCVTFQQQQDNNNSASCSVNHQSLVLSLVSHVLRAPLTDCQSWYYQRQQAADPAGSRRAAPPSLPPPSKGRACQGNSSCRWRLQRSAEWTPILACPRARLSVTVFPPTPPPPPLRPTSWLRSPAVWPPLMTQSSCQRWASRQAERGRPFDEDPDTLQHRQHAGGLWTCSRPSARTLVLEHVL